MKRYRLEIEVSDGRVLVEYVTAENVSQAVQSVLTTGEVLSVASINPDVQNTFTGLLEYSCGCQYPTGEKSGYFDYHCAKCHREQWEH